MFFTSHKACDIPRDNPPDIAGIQRLLHVAPAVYA